MNPGLLFSGQGAQYVGMGRSLFQESEAVRTLYNEANEILGWDLAGISFNGPEEALTETRVCQPALFLHGLALLQILRERSRIDAPFAVCGLSLGELTALTAAGSIGFEDGLRLVAARGCLMQEACERTAGSMASVIGGTPEDVELLAGECGLDIANLNCPGQIVLSGKREGIQMAVEKGRERGFKLVKELVVAGAYHSRLMISAKEGFASFVDQAPIQAPSCLFFSNVTGTAISDPSTIRQCLVEQIVSPVRFEGCVRNMASHLPPDSEFVECGPNRVLAGLVRRTDRSWTVHSFSELDDFDATI